MEKQTWLGNMKDIFVFSIFLFTMKNETVLPLLWFAVFCFLNSSLLWAWIVTISQIKFNAWLYRVSSFKTKLSRKSTRKVWSILKNLQKQRFRGVLRKRCSENMRQIYRRTPMPNCNFNKVALQLYWNHTSVWVFSSKFAAYFQNSFS